MTKPEEWDYFLGELFSRTMEAYQKTEGHTYLEEKRKQLDARVEQLLK